MANIDFRNIYLLGIVVSGLFCSCASTKQLRAHREVISTLAHGELSSKKKMDGLGKELVIVIDESLSRPTALGTYKHVKKFTQQNEKDLEVIYQDLDQWQSNLSGPQKVMVGTELATKSYTRRFITLLPKFKKKVKNKYKQLVFFSKLVNVMNPLRKKEEKGK